MRFDRTTHTVVVICWCGVREVCRTQTAADTWAHAHIDKCHTAPADNARVQRYMNAARVRRHRAK